MAILVTGGAGYIGSHTCVELQKNLFPCLSIMSDTSYAMPAISGDPESATTT